MLQVRHRYLQARRNLEYQKLREIEKVKELLAKLEADKKVLDVPEVKVDESQLLACPNCAREFSTKAGLSSHKRFKKCEVKL